MAWEKIFTNDANDQCLISKIYRKNFIYSYIQMFNNNNKNNPNEKMGNSLKTYRCPIGT